MSRGIKDLREIICVSRLTCRRSSEECDSLSSDDTILSEECSALTLNDKSSSVTNISPDSGCVTNLSMVPQASGEGTQSTSTSKSKQRRKRKKKRKACNEKSDTLRNKSPLPPVKNSTRKLITDIEESGGYNNFDWLLSCVDSDVIATFLTRSNELVSYLTSFCNHKENYVRFARFWLAEFPDLKKQEIYDLEITIVGNELTLAFSAGLKCREVTQKDLMKLLHAIFKEYPGHLLTSHGNYLFLDYLDVLSSSGHTAEYKTLLSAVKCSTQNKEYAQSLLAIRAFTLVNIWSAIVKFYVSFTKYVQPPCLVFSSQDKDSVQMQRMVQSIRLGYTVVIHYLLKSGHVDAAGTDGNGKTWVFHAVMCDQLSVLVFLLTKAATNEAVNRTSNNGNAPLHAAANTGNIKAVRLLLQNPHTDVDVKNTQCDDATPLHLAIMHGQLDVVRALLEAGADIRLKMGNMDALEIARTLSTEEMVELVESQLQ